MKEEKTRGKKGKEEFKRRAISLVDMVIRKLLQDKNFKIDGFVTSDPGHFQDLCSQRRIELYPINE